MLRRHKRDKVTNEEFSKLFNQLPELFENFLNAPLKPWSNLGTLPPNGIYVFYENGCPIYVGRTNRMKARIKEHGRPSSTHNSAPFAFNLARKAAKGKGIDITKPRSQLEKDPTFSALFTEAKTRVSKMSVKVIEIDDPIIQTLFEVYAAITLETIEYNDFDTH